MAGPRAAWFGDATRLGPGVCVVLVLEYSFPPRRRPGRHAARSLASLDQTLTPTEAEAICGESRERFVLISLSLSLSLKNLHMKQRVKICFISVLEYFQPL